MKIPLHMSDEGDKTSKAAQAKALEREVLSAKKGDWNAKNSLVRTFMPLMKSLAEKRSSEPAQINKYIEAAKQGLFTAVKKYKKSIGPEKFQIFALDFMQESMDRQDKGGGFFSRLFGKS